MKRPGVRQNGCWPARMLRNLGAGKRRGYGECEIHLVDSGQETKLLDRFGNRLDGKTVKLVAQRTKTAVLPLALPADPGQHTYRLQVLLRTDEPLLIARRARGWQPVRVAGEHSRIGLARSVGMAVGAAGWESA